MAQSSLSQLPAELLQTIFAQLPISSLLAFAQTSKPNYVLATSVLTYLELAIFPKRIHSVLAFLEEECREDVDDDDDNDTEHLTNWLGPHQPRKQRRPQTAWKRPHMNPELYQISRSTQVNTSRSTSPDMLITGHDRMAVRRSASPTKASPLSLRTTEFITQNDIASTILSSRSIRHNVRSLTLHLYTLHTPELAGILSSLSSLQHLNLNFSHAYINDTTLPASYWRTTPSQGSGSPIWNALAGIGSEASSALRLRNLQTLTLRRAGITACQLRSCIASNPHLKELVLDKVRGVELEFVNWLAEYVSTRDHESIETVVLSDCSELVCSKPGHFEWISKLAQSRISTLSVKDCKNVDDRIFCKLAGLVESSGGSSNSTSNNSSSSDLSMDMDLDTNINMGMDVDLSPLTIQTNSWSHGIYRLISPKGTLIKRGQRILTYRQKQKMGTRSPALTINDYIASTTGYGSGSGSSSHRKQSRLDDMIEVDPDLL